MTLRIIFFLLFLLFSDSLWGQDKRDSIIVEHSFWNDDYFIAGKEQTHKEIRELLQNNQLMANLMSSYNSNRKFGNFILFTGILLTGYSAYSIWESEYSYGEYPHDYGNNRYPGNIDSGTEILYPVFALICDITGIILISNANDSFNQAINLYNNHSTSTSNNDRYELNLEYSLNQIRLTFRF